MAPLTIREVEDADLEAYVAAWNAITPDETTTADKQRERRDRDPRRLYLLAELAGEPLGCGFSGPSDSPGRVFLQPRVLPPARRRGIGSALLERLVDHARELGAGLASSHVDGNDAPSLAFAGEHGFEEVDRQVEQVLQLDRPFPAPDPGDGVAFVSIAERPDLLRESYELAREGYADFAVTTPVEVSLDEWLAEEATLPHGSFVALAGDEIVGYSGLMARDEGVAEDGLTVVRRDWRGRGLATALKRAELAWASANGIREVVTWTQRGNDAMRAVNERLGYAYRSVSVTVRKELA